MPAEKHECDYPYPHTAAACANFKRVTETVNNVHPYADSDGTVKYPPGSGEKAVKFLSRYLP